MKRIILVLALVFFNTLISQAVVKPLMQPYNLDFEEGTDGKLPRGWVLPEYTSNLRYEVQLTSTNPKNGRHCLEISRDQPYKENIYGSAMQSVDASQYRGKMIRYKAALRAEISSPIGSAHLWLIEYLPNDDVAYYDLMEDKPVVSNQWQYYELNAEIHPDAQYINFGVMLKGNGFAWMDDATIEIISADESIKYNKAAKPIQDEGLTNLKALAGIIGYVRYFYPGTEAVQTDWDKFTLDAVEYIEDAKNISDLTDKLKKVFGYVAPGLELFNSPPKDNLKYAPKPEGALDELCLAWIHNGTPKLIRTGKTGSDVLNIYLPYKDSEGTVIQTLDASDLIGKTIKFSVKAKVNQFSAATCGIIRLMPESGNLPTDKKLIVNSELIKSKDWKEYKVNLKIPEKTKTIKIGLCLLGDGDVIFDSAKLMVSDEKSENEYDLKNKDFEEGGSGKISRGWRLVPLSEKSGYSANIIDNEYSSGKFALKITSDLKTAVKYPKPGEFIEFSPIPGLFCRMPIALYADSISTYPKSSVEKFQLSTRPKGFTINPNDRTSRIAVSIISWNIYRLFNLFVDEKVWDKALSEALLSSATITGVLPFQSVLQKLSSYLNDSQARVWNVNEKFSYALPFLWKWVNNKLLVTEVSPEQNFVGLGDEITSINGVLSGKYLNNIMQFISGNNPEWRITRALANIRAGSENSSSKLTIKDKRNNEKELIVPKSIYLGDLNEKRLPELSKIGEKTIYLDLTRITDKIFKILIDSMRLADNIVFDLRGTTTMSEHFLGFFIDKNVPSLEWKLPIRTGPKPELLSYTTFTGEIKSRPILLHKKVIFLMDERSIGFSEAILSLASKLKIGQLIGTSSAGTAGEVESFKIPANYNCSWTGIFLSENGKLINSGVSPTIEVVPTMGSIIEGRDEVLETALNMLK